MSARINYSIIKGADLKRLRKSKNIKAREVARTANISPPTISLIEHEVIRITPEMETRLLAAYKQLGIDTKTLK